MTTPLSKRIPDFSAENSDSKKQLPGDIQDSAARSSVFLNPLPAEIIFQIFNHLTFQNCLSLRLVCTQGQTLADTYVIRAAEKFAAYSSHPEDPKNAAQAFRCLSRVYTVMLTFWKPEALYKTPCASLNWNHLSFESTQLLKKLKSKLACLNGELPWDTLKKGFGDLYPLALRAFGPLISKYLPEMQIKIPPSVLVTAARIDDQDLLQVLIDAKVDVNLRDEQNKRTPLCSAILPQGEFEKHDGVVEFSSNVEGVRRLLEAGADLTQPSKIEFDIEDDRKSLETPFVHALISQEPSILQLLLDKLKSQGQLESFVNTPIRTGLSYNCFSPTYKREKGLNYYLSPLELCIVCMSTATLEMMEMLIQAGADSTRIGSKGRTLLHVFWRVKASLESREESESINTLSTANRLGSELFLAIPRLILKEWRKRGVLHLLNHRSQENRAPLIEAGLNGGLAGFKLLLEAGAIPTASDICDLAVQGFVRCLSLLVAKGISLNQPRKDGLTPLILAVGKPDFCLQLISLGADPTRSISSEGSDIQPEMRGKTTLQILFEHLENFIDRYPNLNRADEVKYLKLLQLILHMTKHQLLGNAPDGRSLMTIARKMNLPSAVQLVEQAYASLTPQEKA